MGLADEGLGSILAVEFAMHRSVWQKIEPSLLVGVDQREPEVPGNDLHLPDVIANPDKQIH